MAVSLRTVDLATEPFLSGRFAPVRDEISADHLPVAGTLPDDLVGHYFRNGPNPEFTPLGSYTYPLEGDGMIHGVWLEGGQARYANRWVRTNGLKAEERAGRALYGGIMTPAFVDTSLLGDDPDPGWPFKLDAFVNVIEHAGRYMALEEGTPPYEVTGALETVGRCDFGGSLPDGLTAHPKIDSETGELVLFRYDVERPFLTWATIGPDGVVTRPVTEVEGIDQGFMIHDFAITRNYAVIVVGPLAFDIDAMTTGGSALAWRPDLGTRVALIPRDGGEVRWVETEPFWAWHYANAYEDGDQIVLDFPGSSAPFIVLPPEERKHITSGFSRATIDTTRATMAVERIDDVGSEFPRIDDRLIGHPHRYVTVASRSGRTALQPAEHDRVLRYDMQAGTATYADTNAAVGEVCFARRAGGTDELDGYYLAYGTGVDSGVSSLYIWDASVFPADPAATVTLPQRVPNGLHGNWFSAA